MLHKIKFTNFILPAAIILGSTAAFANNAAKPKVTAIDQSQGTKHDVETTRLIRQRIVGDKMLSTKAKNINIVTLGDTVTLGGSVNTAQELTAIRLHVSSIATNASIDDRQVTVANKSK